MEIYINGEKISYTLQNEKTLNDVFEFIIAFLDKNDLYIDTIKIDDTQYSFENLDSIKSKSVDEIKKLEIQAAFKQELVSQTVENIISYLTNVVNYIKDNEKYDQENIDKIKEGLSWCTSVVDKIMIIYSISTDYFITKTDKQFSFVVQQMKEMGDNLHLLTINNDFKKEFLSTIVDFMDGIIKIVTYIFVRLKNLPKESKTSHFVIIFSDNIKLLSKLRDLLPKIAENFQSGKEKEAMEIFGSLINYLAFYFEVLILCIDSFSQSEYDFNVLQDLIKQFSDLFGAIKSAISDKDYVNLSDILEYEMAEPLQKLLNETQKLTDFLSTQPSK
ncbi:MAG TPA: hypothetical protein PLN45_03685 [Exilispira sp.]|nr:hypothetical protein [Exilispira sp.]